MCKDQRSSRDGTGEETDAAGFGNDSLRAPNDERQPDESAMFRERMPDEHVHKPVRRDHVEYAAQARHPIREVGGREAIHGQSRGKQSQELREFQRCSIIESYEHRHFGEIIGQRGIELENRGTIARVQIRRPSGKKVARANGRVEFHEPGQV